MNIPSLEVRLRFGPDVDYRVGVLASVERSFAFQYDDAFLSRDLRISPFRLPAQPGVQVYDGQGGMDVFGVFEDSMPDSWGRRLIDRHFQVAQGRAPGVLERLAYVGDRGMGALTFHPPAEGPCGPDAGLDLAGLADEAWAFDEDKVEDALPELRRAGGTSGGARPKVLVGLPERSVGDKGVLPGDGDLPAGYAHWIVKFNTREDGPESGPLEFAYAELASRAGVAVPTHRLIETRAGRFYAVRRFDRPSRGERLHLHSAAGLLHADFRTPGDEYDVLFRLTQALTHDYSQMLELFRRACLNVLACNRDDHLKNFAYLMDRRGTWHLAPFFDFTFHTGPNGWHTLSVAGEGRDPHRSDLVRLAEQADIRKADALRIIDQVRNALAAFASVAGDAGVSKRTITRMSSRLRELDA